MLAAAALVEVEKTVLGDQAKKEKKTGEKQYLLLVLRKES